MWAQRIASLKYREVCVLRAQTQTDSHEVEKRMGA